MIPPEIEALLEPLERFEAIRRGVARMGGRLADLSYANPYEGARDAARATLREALDDQRLLDLQYTPFGGHTLARRATADALRASHELDFAFSDVILTPGAMSALHIALRVAGRPGDEVVIPVPCWLDFPLYATAIGLVPRFVPLEGPRFDLDLDAVRAALGPRTSALVLGHPANPTGRAYGAETFEALATTMREAEARHGRPITLIADETHRDFVADDLYRSAVPCFDRTLLVYSFGKYHFIQGQRLGYAAASPRHPERDKVAAEMVRWTRIDAIATPTALMQRALPQLLELRHDHGWIVEWRQRTVEALRGHGYTVTDPDGTMFVYAATPPGYEDDFAFTEELAGRGVLVLPAPVFHHRGHFRLSLTSSEEMLERALEVLGQVADE